MLPWPLAQALRRANNEKTAQGRHHSAYFFFEATLKLATCAQLGTYFSLGAPDKKLNEQLDVLARASAGSWLGLLREVSKWIAAREDASLLPLADVYGRLSGKTALPAALAFLDREKKEVTPRKVRVLDLFSELVSYRNDNIGHGAQRDTAFYDSMAPLILDAVTEVIEYLQPFGDFKLGLSRDTSIEATGETVRRFMVLRGDGMVDYVDATEEDAATPAGRLWFVQGAARIPLHPLVIYEAGDTDRIGFLNKVVSKTKAETIVVRRCEYLDYYTGDRLQSRDAAEELAKLFTQLRGRPVSAEEVEKLSLEKGSETELIHPYSGNATIGDFELLGELGRGGMGIVYKARQLSMERIVALKVLPPGLSGDPIAVARFQREIKALGLCDHPNVVKVLTAGRDGDRDYYAMEYVDGCDLSALYDVLRSWDKGTQGKLREGHITRAITSAGTMTRARKEISDGGGGLSEDDVRKKLAEAIPDAPVLKEGRAAYLRLAELMADAADGLQHMHDRGILHRDIKPANLMLTADGKRTVLMDFGLARLDEAASLTRSADKILGTLRYMPPEQADVQLRGELVSERSDIYSLGATIYELATLSPIFEGANQIQLLEQVQRREPILPRKHRPDLPQDFETIILKATQKDHLLRYAKVGPVSDPGTMGADLKAFANGSPISARPPSAFHYLKLFYRRNRGLANAAAAVLLLLTLSTAAFLYFLNQERVIAELSKKVAETAQQKAEAAQQQAEADRAKAERAQGEANVARAEAEAAQQELSDLLTQQQIQFDLAEAAAARKIGEYEREAMYLARAHSLSADSVSRLTVLSKLSGSGQLWSSYTPFAGFRGILALAPSAQIVAGAKNGGGLACWNSATGELLHKFGDYSGNITCLAFSPDGRTLLSGSSDQTIRLWDVKTGKELQIFAGHTGDVVSVVFSPDGRTALSGSYDKTVRLWDVVTGKELRRIGDHTGWVAGVAFSPDGRTVLSGSWDKFLRLWDVDTGRVLREFPGHTDRINCVEFSPDGRTVLSGSADTTVRLWDLNSGEELSNFPGGSEVKSVAFSSDGHTVASGDAYGIVRLWDLEVDEEPRILEGHGFQVDSISFSQDGLTLFSGSPDEILRLWDVQTGMELRSFEAHASCVLCLAFSPDTRTVLSGSWDFTLRLWDVRTARELRKFEGHTAPVFCLSFSPDGRTALSGSWDQTLRLWDLATGRELRKFEGHTKAIRSISFSPDGLTVLSGSSDATVRLWEVETGKELHRFDEHSSAVIGVAFSPDGRTVLSGSADQTVFLWDVGTGRLLHHFKGDYSRWCSVAFSPDGRTVVSGSVDRTLRLWDTETGRERRKFEGHTHDVRSVAFSPDGRTLLSGSWDSTLRLWDAGTGKELRKFEGHSLYVVSVAFSPDGRTVASGSWDKSLRLWDVGSVLELRRFEQRKLEARSIAFGPHGRTAFSLDVDKTLSVWDVATGKEKNKIVFKEHAEEVLCVAISSDGRTALSGSKDNTLRLWDVATGKEKHKNVFRGHTEEVLCVAISPDGRTALSGSKDDTLRLWNLATGYGRIVFKEHGNDVLCVAFSPDGLTALSGSKDRSLRLWRIDTGKELRSFQRHTMSLKDKWFDTVDLASVTSVAFGRKGLYALSGGEDKTVRLWDVVTGRELRTFEGHNGSISSVAFSRDGSTALTGSADESVRLWSVATGDELFTFKGHTKAVASVAFSPDGRTAISASKDGSIRLWVVPQPVSVPEDVSLLDYAESKTGMHFRGLIPVPNKTSFSRSEWDTSDGLPPEFLRGPLPDWFDPNEMEKQKRESQAKIGKTTLNTTMERRSYFMRDFNKEYQDRFEGYRYIEEQAEDGTVSRTHIPARKRNRLGRYVGKPMGYIDYARYWDEKVKPTFTNSGH